jgi:7,8-dihydro-6-hydroxymethylpterin-pyrophosphokinase
LAPLVEIAPELAIPGEGRLFDLLGKISRQRIERLP